MTISIITQLHLEQLVRQKQSGVSRLFIFWSIIFKVQQLEQCRKSTDTEFCFSNVCARHLSLNITSTMQCPAHYYIIFLNKKICTLLSVLPNELFSKIWKLCLVSFHLQQVWWMCRCTAPRPCLNTQTAGLCRRCFVRTTESCGRGWRS